MERVRETRVRGVACCAAATAIVRETNGYPKFTDSESSEVHCDRNDNTIRVERACQGWPKSLQTTILRLQRRRASTKARK